MAEIVRGTYRHFKGGVYCVLGTATHSETGDELVIYHKVGSGLVVTDEEQRLWARPTKMWNETVFRHGSEKPRFELLNTIPTADVVERRTGKWLHEQLLPDNVYGHMVAECSVCHEVRIVDNYCPNCGSKNEVGQDEQH